MNLRLEQENDDLAHELVNSKIALRNDLDGVSVLRCLLRSIFFTRCLWLWWLIWRSGNGVWSHQQS